MAALTPEQRARLIRATREPAAAFLEDMRHLRDIIANKIPPRAELRRASAVLRRLLIEGDLTQVAGPRIGKVLIRQFDNQVFYRIGLERRYAFFGSCGVDFGGAIFRGISAEQRTLTPAEVKSDYEKGVAYPPDKLEEVRLDSFLSQQILCFLGNWISRRVTIKYVANVASGVHSGSEIDAADHALTRVRQTVRYRLFPGQGFEINIQGFSADLLDDFKYSITHLDPVLAEIHATIRLLTESPSIVELEKIVSAELGLIA
jgi:hypothetical protein